MKRIIPKKKSPVRVIVGRFQEPLLHPGHRFLFEYVISGHSDVLVILGVPYTSTSRNPLSFAMRACGLSGVKVATIHALAETLEKGTIDMKTLHKLADAEIISALTSVKGIGPWTAEMILMFSLGRTDIFSKGDLGLRKGIMRLYGLKKMPSDRMMDKLAKNWSPYRTYAARVLWRVADEGKEK